MKTTLVKFGLIFCSLTSANAKVQTSKSFAYDKRDSLEVVYSIDRKSLILTPKLKYELKRNDQKEVVEKKAYRRNAGSKEWTPYYALTVTIADNERVLEYAEWNPNKKEFNLNLQKACYSFDALNKLSAYSLYHWDN